MYLLDSLQTKERKYYVYRFLNKDNVIIYVGRTVDFIFAGVFFKDFAYGLVLFL